MRATQLCQLCHTWRAKVQPIPGSDDLESWGPSEGDLQIAGITKVTGSWDEHIPEESDARSDSNASEEADWIDIVDDDGELLDSVEAVAFGDEYRESGWDYFPYEHTDDSTAVYSHTAGSQSPKKRAREMQ